jgi:hypothetical protein
MPWEVRLAGNLLEAADRIDSSLCVFFGPDIAWRDRDGLS